MLPQPNVTLVMQWSWMHKQLVHPPNKHAIRCSKSGFKNEIQHKLLLHAASSCYCGCKVVLHQWGDCRVPPVQAGTLLCPSEPCKKILLPGPNGVSTAPTSAACRWDPQVWHQPCTMYEIPVTQEGKSTEQA